MEIGISDGVGGMEFADGIGGWSWWMELAELDG
jgi:hypothetical protein